MTTPVTCARCAQTAAQLLPAAAVADYYGDSAHTADDLAREDGTYNPATNRFLCDACYIAQGMPAFHVNEGRGNWTVDQPAPPTSTHTLAEAYARFEAVVRGGLELPAPGPDDDDEDSWFGAR
jgi:hypothetical protein